MKQSTDKPRISRRLDKAGRQLVSRYAQYASPELRKALRSVRAAIRERTFFVVELERPAQDVGRRGVSIASVGHTLPPSREVSLRFLNR